MPQLFIFALSLLILAAAPALSQEIEKCTPALNVLQNIDKVKPILDGKVIVDTVEVEKLVELDSVQEKGYNVAAALAHGHGDFTLLFGFKVDSTYVLCEGHTVPAQKLHEFLAIVLGKPAAPGREL